MNAEQAASWAPECPSDLKAWVTKQHMLLAGVDDDCSLPHVYQEVVQVTKKSEVHQCYQQAIDE